MKPIVLIRLLYLILCAAALPVQAQSTAPQKPTLYLLTVGVSKYQDPINTLSFPAKDAADVSTLFRAQQGRLFGKVVAVTLIDQEATREAVIRNLVALRRQGRQMKPTDYVLVFLAGHGTVNDLGEYFFAPSDVDTSELDSTGVSWVTFSQTLAALPGHTLLMLETSHAAAFAAPAPQSRYGQLLGAAETARANDVPPLILLAACGAGETSQESAAWNRGAFARALVEGLNGKADADHNGVVTMTELGKYVGARVAELTQDAQHPVSIKPSSVPSELPLALVK